MSLPPAEHLGAAVGRHLGHVLVVVHAHGDHAVQDAASAAERPQLLRLARAVLRAGDEALVLPQGLRDPGVAGAFDLFYVVCN